jgi:asparagine synthetase B (glutamine-hydrolysing)
MEDLYEVPPCDTRGRYFDESGVTAQRPNELAKPTSEPDESAVFSVLQFGAVIPPLSPWRGVRRLLPGYRYRGTELIAPVELRYPRSVADLDPERQADEVEGLLDGILKRIIGDRRDPVLLFSGGVDSGLIASRLAALGYRDSLLINYSFGGEDLETRLAEAMAKHLGLRYVRIPPERDLCDCLIEPGRVYSQPFGDRSTIPTWDLAHAAADRLYGGPRLVIDGTGADGAFGMTGKIAMWGRVLRVPALFRRAASLFYRPALWHRRGGLEYLSRILKRSVDMPPLSAALAQNPLAGTLYLDAFRGSIDILLSDWIGGWSGDSLPHRIVAGDLALTCSSMFAQKGKPILERAGHEVAYPFLETDMVSLAMEALPHWRLAEAKAPLKRCLVRYVPRGMVYRKKSAFVDRSGAAFFTKEFIAHLRAAADESSPIAFALNSEKVLKACDLLARGKMLPPQTLSCLWTVTFMDRWYRSARKDVIASSLCMT